MIRIQEFFEDSSTLRHREFFHNLALCIYEYADRIFVQILPEM